MFDSKFDGNCRMHVQSGFPLFSKYQIPGFLKVFRPNFQIFSSFIVPNSRYFHTNFSYKNLEMC